MSSSIEYMPVLKWEDYGSNCPHQIPMYILNEGRARDAHGQTLLRLKERGGLSPKEILANVLDKPFREVQDIPKHTVVAMLRNIINKQTR